MSEERGKGDIMPTVIERIIKSERTESDAFIEKQNIRIKQLKEIERNKAAGKNIPKNEIIVELQAAGILDKYGELASPYLDKEQNL